MEKPESLPSPLPNRLDALHRCSSPLPKQRWRIPKPDNAIIVCVSPGVLFDIKEEQKIFVEKGPQEYRDYMITHEEVPLCPGPAFSFIHTLHNMNDQLLKLNPNEKELFDVVLIGNQPGVAGITFVNSINYHGLTIERICLTGGNSVIEYLSGYGTKLYLSYDEDSVIEALDIGIPAASMKHYTPDGAEQSNQLRIAFDGDAVLFSDEAEVYAKTGGMDKFFEYEQSKADVPLPVGPIHKFAMTLGRLQQKFRDGGVKECPIRTYFVTSRSAQSCGVRALKTLRSLGLDMDELSFLSGAPKGPILAKIRPHLFFDDEKHNVVSAVGHGVASAHVPYGIAHFESEQQH